VNPALERTIGRALRSVRAGDRHLFWNAPALAEAPDTILLASPAFAMGGTMPVRHAVGGIGDNVSPALHWSGVPDHAAELVLVVQDPDAPLPRPVVHAIVTGIPPTWGELPEGALAKGTAAPVRIGRGSFGRVGYAGPRPVRGHGPHRYIFQIVASDRTLGLDRPADLKAVLAALSGHVIARGRLVGLFERV
jgi:Raf kinase inhibitor-like YbhB/YbcL family protein